MPTVSCTRRASIQSTLRASSLSVGAMNDIRSSFPSRVVSSVRPRVTPARNRFSELRTSSAVRAFFSAGRVVGPVSGNCAPRTRLGSSVGASVTASLGTAPGVSSTAVTIAGSWATGSASRASSCSATAGCCSHDDGHHGSFGTCSATGAGSTGASAAATGCGSRSGSGVGAAVGGTAVCGGGGVSV